MSLTVTLNGDLSVSVEQPTPLDYPLEPPTENFEDEARIDAEMVANDFNLTQNELDAFLQRHINNLTSRGNYLTEIKNAL